MNPAGFHQSPRLRDVPAGLEEAPSCGKIGTTMAEGCEVPSLWLIVHWGRRIPPNRGQVRCKALDEGV